MKTLKSIKSKIIMFILALIFPLTASGLVYSLNDLNVAKADDTTSSAHYYSGYMNEISVTNNNFNSSTSSYSISTSLSGWTGQVTNSNTTAGIINTGNTFQNYMTGTYHLSKNPLAKATDRYILMINSKTTDSNSTTSNDAYKTARQGYKSSTISLDANSFYSFQVAFKNDTNYNPITTYTHLSDLDEEVTLSQDTFDNVAFNEDGTVAYLPFSYNSRTYYLEKRLEEHETLSGSIENITPFYEDEAFLGFMKDNTPVYVSVDDITRQEVEVNEETETHINVNNGAILYTCPNITYNSSSNNYTVPTSTPYYTTNTEYTSLNDYVYGSIYLSGLTDENGDPVKAEYVQVTSKEWVTFYFFVATGNEDQSVSLDLWLGTNVPGHESSGVAFFDDVHVYKYSENTFWNTYKSYFGRSYTQEITNNDVTTVQEFDCVSLVDLRTKDVLEIPDSNFDFEEGTFNDNLSSLKNWTKVGAGNAQVFNTRSPEYFKSVTGYDFVGSSLSASVEIDGETIDVTPNNYLLGLWAQDNYVSVKSQNIDITANEIYKIKAYYKISSLKSGNVYLLVEENDSVIKNKYGLNLDENNTQYTLTSQTASSAVTANGDSEYNNEYGVIEFYVKGGALYDSSINFSLSLGTNEENATGCVVFDDITIEKATTEEYDNASNKVQLNSTSGTLTVPNGNFNLVTIEDENYPLTAQNWTVTNGDGLLFNGVINTQQDRFKGYEQRYEQLKSEGVDDIDNPFYWASAMPNPNSSSNSTTDNVMMLANIHSTWQSLKSDNISLEADSTYRLTFKYKTLANEKFKVSLFGEEGFKLFESDYITSNGTWKDYDIYLKSFAGANNVYVVIDFGTTTESEYGYLYLDNFNLLTIESTEYDDKANTASDITDIYGVVDMTDFYLNIPTNTQQNNSDYLTTPAYTGSISSNPNNMDSSALTGGLVTSDKWSEGNYYYIQTDSEEPENVFFIQTQGIGTYTLESNFNIDLTADSYYVLSFKLKTNFIMNENDKDKEPFGVTFGLTGFDYMTELVSDEDYQTYTMYFHPTEDASAKLHIALISSTQTQGGSMAIYDLAFETTDENTYNRASDTVNASGYDINEDRVYISSAENAEDENPDENPDGSESEDKNNNNSNFTWLLAISTIITALAIIIAIVGTVLRKVKIKKIERKRTESYDRKTSLNVDVIKAKAEKQRDAELEEVKVNITRFQTELDNLEKLHKQKVLNLREKDKGKVSKETDREFKLFAQKRTVIVEKIDSLNKQIEQIKSPEYLLSLQRKVYAQEEMKQKELAKVSKKLNKKQSSEETKNSSKETKTENKKSKK